MDGLPRDTTTAAQPPHHEHGAHDEHDKHEHGTGAWARLRHALTPHSHDHTEAIQTADEASRHGIGAAWLSLAGMGSGHDHRGRLT